METKPMPDYGDIMTVKEFIACCECGIITDWDGSGYYAASKEAITDLACSPSDVMSGKVDDRFGYVVWFNK